MGFYTYMWLRKDGTPYYVGKGKGNRAFTNDYHTVYKPSKDRIIIQEMSSEEEAFEAEKFFIAFYGRIDMGTGCLRNRTDGGDGSSGCKNLYKFSTKPKYDLLGKKFGKLLVVGYTPSRPSSRNWKCVCDCGEETYAESYSLRSGHTTSCGCINRALNLGKYNTRRYYFQDQKIGRLTALYPIAGRGWFCRCDCGKEVVVYTENLVAGNTKSCGCLNREVIKMKRGEKKNVSRNYYRAECN